MTRYFLDLTSGGAVYVDNEGTECDSRESALLEARHILGEVLRDGTPTSTRAEIGPLGIVVRIESVTVATLDLTLSVKLNPDEMLH